MSRWRNSLGELRTAKSKNPAQLQRTTWLYRGFFFLADENERFLNTSWRQQFCPCEKLFNELKILTWAVPNSARVNTSHEKPSGWPRSFWRLIRRFCPGLWNWPAISTAHPARNTKAVKARERWQSSFREYCGSRSVSQAAWLKFSAVFISLLDDWNLKRFSNFLAKFVSPSLCIRFLNSTCL